MKYIYILILLSQCLIALLLFLKSEPYSQNMYPKEMSVSTAKTQDCVANDSNTIIAKYIAAVQSQSGQNLKQSYNAQKAENMRELQLQFKLFHMNKTENLWTEKAKRTETGFTSLPYSIIENMTISESIPDTHGNWKLMYKDIQGFVLVQALAWFDTRPELPDSSSFRIHVIAPTEHVWFFVDSEETRFVAYVQTSSAVLKLDNYTFKITCCRRARRTQNIPYANFLLVFKLKNSSISHEILHGQGIKKFTLVSSHYQSRPNELEVKIIKADNDKNKKDFFLCLKPMFGDFSIERLPFLVEWIELHRLLGVDHIYMYNNSLGTPVEMKNILNHYQSLGYLTIKQYTSPFQTLVGPSVIQTKYAASSIIDISAQTMCYYDHLNEYHYMLSVDLDEIILPLEHPTYTDLFQDLQNDNVYNKATSILFPWAYFHTTEEQGSTTSYSTILTHRSYSLVRPWLNITEFDDAEHYNSKAFTSTKWCSFLFNHHCRVNNPQYPMVFAPLQWGMTHHYRNRCVSTVDRGLHCKRKMRNLPVLNQVFRYEETLQKLLIEKYRMFNLTIRMGN